MSYVFNNLKFLLKEEDEDPTGGLLDNSSDSNDNSGSTDTDASGDDGFGMDSDTEGDGLDLGGSDEEGEESSIEGDDGENSAEDKAKEVIDIIGKADDSLNNVANFIGIPYDFDVFDGEEMLESNLKFDIFKELNKKKLSSSLMEGPWDSAIKKSEEFEEKLKIIKKPYEDFFDAKAEFDVESVAKKAAKLFLKFDSLIDKYEIVKYFASIDIALNGPEDKSALNDVLEDFEVLLQNYIKEGGGELQNASYTIEPDRTKTAVGASANSGG